MKFWFVLSIAAIPVLLACSQRQLASPGTLRFVNAPPVMVVDDRKPIEQPTIDEDGLVEYYFREDFVEPARRALTVKAPRRATNINSLGEVPNSSWFTNRWPTPAEVQRGPAKNSGPSREGVWRVVGVKIGGASIGLFIIDANNDRYIINFDEIGYAETETSADVVVERLAWAFGYNVPENEVVSFERDQLVLDPSANVTDRAGQSRKMTDEDLKEYLGQAENDNGVFRVLASKFIDGKVLGGFVPDGTLVGDENDRVPHELRRDLRGQRILWAWVNHVDLKQKNTMASYTSGKYVKRYTLDFGKSLGTWALIDGLQRLGHRGNYGFKAGAISLITAGLYVHPWERRVTYPNYRGLGFLDSEHFDPSTWLPNHEWRPTSAADRFDELWGAEILMRFTPEHIKAAITAAKYTDKRTSDYLLRVLLERQRKLGHYAFSRLAPLTNFAVSRSRRTNGEPTASICFRDLWRVHGFARNGAATRYQMRSWDYQGHPVDSIGRLQSTTEGTACIDGAALSSSEKSYTIVQIDVRRGGHRLPPVFVHIAENTNGKLRVVGLDRR